MEDLAGEQGLDTGGLAPADLADDHGVGAGDDLRFVELPRVVAERRAVEVPADVDLPAGQAPFGHERVGGLEVAVVARWAAGGWTSPSGWLKRLMRFIRPPPPPGAAAPSVLDRPPVRGALMDEHLRGPVGGAEHEPFAGRHRLPPTRVAAPIRARSAAGVW